MNEELIFHINYLEELNNLTITRDYISISEAMQQLGINSKTRKHYIVAKRYIFWKHLYKKGYTVSQIGRLTGYDHSSIIHGLSRLRNKYMKEYYAKYQNEVDVIVKNIKFD